MAFITSPMLMALPSLLVRNTVLCPVFVTDIVVGGLAVLLVSAGACVWVEAPDGTDDDPVGNGAATGVGVCGSLNCTPDVL